MRNHNFSSLKYPLAIWQIAQGASSEAMEVAIEELNIFEIDDINFAFPDVVSNGRVFHADGEVLKVL